MANYRNKFYTEITEDDKFRTKRDIQPVEGQKVSRVAPERLIADTELNTFRTRNYMVLEKDGEEGIEIRFQPGDLISGLV